MRLGASGEQALAAPGWRGWLAATRPPTLSAAVAPVLVGSALAYSGDEFTVLVFVATLAAAVLIQIGTNLANDAFDFEQGADDADRLGPARITASGQASAAEVKIASGIAFGLAALVGVFLIIEGGWPILAIGVASIAAGLAYTGGPWPLGYHGLGDLFVFVFFGLVAVMGTYYLQAGSVTTLAFLASLPLGLTVAAILVVNNVRDIETDRRAGKLTLSVRLGERISRRQYVLMILAAFVLLPVLVVGGAGLAVGLALLAAPLAIVPCRSVLQGAEGAALNVVLKQTTLFHLVFGSLLAVGLLL